MAEPDHDGISARLRRLPGQFLLALLNATAILVIVAAILVLVAIARVEYFAGNITATMTDAVLSKVDLPSRDVLANIKELTGEVRALRNDLRDIRTGENPVLQSQITRLKDSLAALSTGVDRLRNAKSILTDEVAARFGDTITQTLMKLRDCHSNVGSNGASLPPDRGASAGSEPELPRLESTLAFAVDPAL
jgi:hypothetical protein